MSLIEVNLNPSGASCARAKPTKSDRDSTANIF